VVASYLHAVAAGAPVDGWAAPATPAQRRSLARLARRISAIPIETLTVETAPVDLPGARGGVIATLNAELGPAPSTRAMLIGQVALAAEADRHGRWWVVEDISEAHRTILNRRGLFSLRGLHYSVGTSSVVIDATGRRELSYGARVAQRTADHELPSLNARYGGPRRALIAVVPETEAVEVFIPNPPPVESAAITWHGSVVLVEGPWTAWGDPGAQGVVVHELTHLVTERWMAGVPASLAEGLAQDEQDRYLRRHGRFLGLDPLVAAYRHGYPTLDRWHEATTGWGLSDSAEVELAYADGRAMVHTVLDRHGGLRGLRRLADTFTRLGGPLAFSSADVRRAFRAGLGVPFSRVARDARAWVLSRSWSGLGASAT
jgi:hypothetical protein